MPSISAHIDIGQFRFDSSSFNEMTDSIQQDSSNDCKNSAVKTNHQLGLFALIKRSPLFKELIRRSNTLISNRLIDAVCLLKYTLWGI